LLTRNYSVLGLIGAMLISSLPPLIYSLWMASRRFGVGPDFRSSLIIYPSSFISAIPVFLLMHSPFPSLGTLILSGAVYSAVYLTVMPLMGGIKLVDIENFKTIFGKIKLLKPFVSVILRYESVLAKS
jgi:hypothetical protein